MSFCSKWSSLRASCYACEVSCTVRDAWQPFSTSSLRSRLGEVFEGLVHMVAMQSFIGPALPPDWDVVPPSTESRAVESYGGLTGLQTQTVRLTPSRAPPLVRVEGCGLPARARAIIRLSCFLLLSLILTASCISQSTPSVSLYLSLTAGPSHSASEPVACFITFFPLCLHTSTVVASKVCRPAETAESQADTSIFISEACRAQRLPCLRVSAACIFLQMADTLLGNCRMDAYSLRWSSTQRAISTVVTA